MTTPDPSKTVQTPGEIAVEILSSTIDGDSYDSPKLLIMIKEAIQHERDVVQEEIRKIYQDCADIVATADSKTIAYKLICEKIK